MNWLSSYLAIKPGDASVDQYMAQLSSNEIYGSKISTSGRFCWWDDLLKGNYLASGEENGSDNIFMKILNRVFLKDLDDEMLKQVEEATKHRKDLERKVFASKPERLSQSLIEGAAADDNTSISVQDFKTNSKSHKRKTKKTREKDTKETFGL